MAEKLTVAQQCEQIRARVHAATDNPEDPGQFKDPHSAIRNRDKAIAELALAVDTLCSLVTELDSKVNGN